MCAYNSLSGNRHRAEDSYQGYPIEDSYEWPIVGPKELLCWLNLRDAPQEFMTATLFGGNSHSLFNANLLYCYSLLGDFLP